MSEPVSDEVRDMISKALREEPPVRVDYDAVVADGRRRRTRRQVGIVGGAVLGVAAVVGSAVLVGGLGTNQSLVPAGPTPGTTTPAPPAPGCVVPARTGGFTQSPPGTASPEELAESARLSEAFARFAVPLPAGVSMDPAAARLCAIKDSWGAQFTLHSAAGDRAVFIEVQPSGPRQPDVCPPPTRRARCAVRSLADQTPITIIEDPPASATQPVMVSVTALRADGTLVRVMETGSESPRPAPRILTDDALAAIVSAPQLKVDWPAPAVVWEPSEKRAAELTTAMTTSGWLGPGVRVPMADFRVSQGGYKASVDIRDNAGIGNLFINLNPPAGDGSVSCAGQTGCEPVAMPDGRAATVTRLVDGRIQRLMLNTVAADGTQIYLMCTNQSDKAATQGKSAPTRPIPPLTVDDLIRIAVQSWLHG